MTGLVAAVRQEHRLVLELLTRLVGQCEQWPIGEHRARRILHQLVAEESHHDVAEARVVWPVVRDALPEYASVRASAMAQEHEARKRLQQLHKAAGTDAVVSLLPGVERSLKAHIGLEEAEILPALQRSLSTNDSIRLGRLYCRVSAAGPTRPHPLVPAVPGILALTTPLAARADRVRDFLRLG
jgi:hemerythrin-like domain-containing protein